MKLSKEQIQSLEHRLQKNGLTYWDISIEILDHLASEIETKMSNKEPYESAVDNAFQKLNLLGDLSGLNRSKLIAINKIVRKQFFNEIVNLFKSLITLVALIVFVSIYSFFFFKANITLFKYATFTLLAIPVLLGAYYHLKEFYIKKKSGYLIYTSFYVFFAILLLNVIFQFCKPEGLINVTSETQKLIWFIATTVNTTFSIAGLRLHFKTLKKIKNIQKELV